MKQVEYIIVGLGIAGISMCEQLRKHNKTFIVIDSGKDGSTAKSGGVFNPTVLKRFTAAWNAAVFFPVAKKFYLGLSEKTAVPLFYEGPILRIFKSVEEQNNWSVATDKRELQNFLSTEFISNSNEAIKAPYGFGAVTASGQIETNLLLESFRASIAAEGLLLNESFQYKAINMEGDKLRYNDILASKIIFCEGANVIHNPFFPKQAIVPNKGEYLLIKAPDLKLDTLLKGPVYVIPVGDDMYKVGATYSRDDSSLNVTEEAKDEILSKLRTFINCSFEVVGQTAGVRPTTRDHRPLLGAWKESSNLFFFNGLGSRGFLMAPFLAEIFFNHVENQTPLSKEFDIKRTLNWK